MSRFIFFALIITVTFKSVSRAQSHFEFFEPVTPPRTIQVMVHRGMQSAAPENSEAAIQKCIEDFCEWAEVDIRLTQDGHHVIIHDPSIDSTTNGNGNVSDLTLDQIKSLDSGAWFAQRFAGTRLLTLPELLGIAKGKINLYLDCKQVNPELLVEEIRSSGMERQVIVYGNPAIAKRVKTLSNDAIAVMLKYRAGMEFTKFMNDYCPAAVEIDANEITPEICQRFHQAGVRVQAKVLGQDWDQPSVWERVIDAGVDWLQTDKPAEILFFHAKRKIGKFPVMIACHRGANRYAPENTLPAIRLSAALGADFAEIDIRTTKDGKHVLIHDSLVNRTTEAKGAVRDMSFDDITRLSAGTWFGKPFQDTRVPSFEEGLLAHGPTMGSYLDAKDISPEDLVAAINTFGFSHRHVVYQSVEYCDRLRKLEPTIRTMPPLRRREDLPAVIAIGAYAVDAKWTILSEETISGCHRHNIKVFSDALGQHESVEHYQKAIRWGIDCIQTDHPLRVLRAIEILHEPKPE